MESNSTQTDTEVGEQDKQIVATTDAHEDGWLDWWAKSYGTPNDWIDARPTLKGYQQSANEFFVGLGNWGYETTRAYFPVFVDPLPTQKRLQQKREQEMQAVENAPVEEVD